MVRSDYPFSIEIIHDLNRLAFLIVGDPIHVIHKAAKESRIIEIRNDLGSRRQWQQGGLIRGNVRFISYQYRLATASISNDSQTAGVIVGTMGAYTPLANINAFYTALEEFNETRN